VPFSHTVLRRSCLGGTLGELAAIVVIEEAFFNCNIYSSEVATRNKLYASPQFCSPCNQFHPLDPCQISKPNLALKAIEFSCLLPSFSSYQSWALGQFPLQNALCLAHPSQTLHKMLCPIPPSTGAMSQSI